MRFVFFLFFFFSQLFVSVFSQSVDQTFLNKLKYEKLLEVFNKYEGDSIAQSKIARTYLNKARNDKDTIKIARGYDRLARAFSPKTNIVYADSLIEYTKHWEHITYPGMGFILKAKGFGDMQNLKQEFNYFKLAYQEASKQNNTSQKVYTLSILILHRVTWGNKEEALKWQHQLNKILNDPEYIKKTEKETRKEYFYNIDNIYLEQKLNSDFSFAYVLYKNNQLDSARFIIGNYYKRLNKYYDFNKELHHDKILDLSMEIEFFSKNYFRSLEYRDTIILKNKKLSNYDLKRTLLFGGLSKIKLNKTSEGIFDLKKADSIYNMHSLLFDFFDKRLLKETLINYTVNLNKKLEYTKTIISIDSILKINYLAVEPDIIQSFETPKLLQEKETIIENLEETNKKSNTFLYLSFLFLLIISSIATYFYWRQMLFKNRFLALLDIKNETPKKDSIQKNALEGISIDIVNDIIKKLTHFEKNKWYLKKDISLQQLSKDFSTNANYLSRILKSKKNKNFPQYINNLRIEYAIFEMRNNPEFKKYTIDAIAKECGYNSGSSFSRVFFKHTGIPPSYYLNQLSKINPEPLMK